MDKVNLARSTTQHFVLSAIAVFLQATLALGATPYDDAQAQARTLLSPSPVHWAAGRKIDKIGSKTHLSDAAGDAQRQAQRLLLGMNTPDSVRAPASTLTDASKSLARADSDPHALGDAQEAARRVITGRDERGARPAMRERRPDIPSVTMSAR